MLGTADMGTLEMAECSNSSNSSTRKVLLLGRGMGSKDTMAIYSGAVTMIALSTAAMTSDRSTGVADTKMKGTEGVTEEEVDMAHLMYRPKSRLGTINMDMERLRLVGSCLVSRLEAAGAGVERLGLRAQLGGLGLGDVGIGNHL